nr:mucin-22 isoform X2 [Crassostrea gigas]
MNRKMSVHLLFCILYLTVGIKPRTGATLKTNATTEATTRTIITTEATHKTTARTEATTKTITTTKATTKTITTTEATTETITRTEALEKTVVSTGAAEKKITATGATARTLATTNALKKTIPISKATVQTTTNETTEKTTATSEATNKTVATTLAAEIETSGTTLTSAIVCQATVQRDNVAYDKINEPENVYLELNGMSTTASSSTDGEGNQYYSTVGSIRDHAKFRSDNRALADPASSREGIISDGQPQRVSEANAYLYLIP